MLDPVPNNQYENENSLKITLYPTFQKRNFGYYNFFYYNIPTFQNLAKLPGYFFHSDNIGANQILRYTFTHGYY